MNPLLTFSAGLIAGITALNLLKNTKNRVDLDSAQQRVREAGTELGDRAREGFGAAQTRVRESAIAGLSALEQSSARLRGRLSEAAPQAEAAAPSAPPAATTAPAPQKARKAPRRKAATRTPRAGGSES